MSVWLGKKPIGSQVVYSMPLEANQPCIVVNFMNLHNPQRYIVGDDGKVKGAVLDVAVDIRKGSPTYGQHVAVELTEDNHRQFFIPKGFAHGFAVLSETAVFQYKCDNFYHPEADGGISILDESLGIDWQIPTDKAILSEKDTKHPMLKDFDSPF